MATREATWNYRDRFNDHFARTYFRGFAGTAVSSIGVGTYRGEATDEADERYLKALIDAVESGINVIDTARNYRHGRSEHVVGEAIRAAEIEREAILLCSKAGFVAFESERPADPAGYVRDRYIDTGLAASNEIVKGNCITPAFVSAQLDRSLSALGVGTIDMHYINNPETQLERFDHETVYDRLEDTFTMLEKRAAAGDIRHYGVASWECFRVPKSAPDYLSLPEIVRRARAAAVRAGNTATHLRAIQLPFNIGMADAFTVESHVGAEGPQSALWFAQNAGLNVFTSASIRQGSLASEMPENVANRIEGDTLAQKAINFARSGPGITASVVGMGSPEHVRENIGAGMFKPLGASLFDDVFE
jgi:aryl-alcohol dehydrogenase-like predicted oxidoreductase